MTIIQRFILCLIRFRHSMKYNICHDSYDDSQNNKIYSILMVKHFHITYIQFVGHRYDKIVNKQQLPIE